MRSAGFWIALIAVAMPLEPARARAGDPQLAGDILPLLKTRCVKCHGPAKQEAKLNLSTPGGLARGGESGQLIASANPAGSLLWQRVEADEMPPDDPLPAEEKAANEALARSKRVSRLFRDRPGSDDPVGSVKYMDRILAENPTLPPEDKQMIMLAKASDLGMLKKLDEAIRVLDEAKALAPDSETSRQLDQAKLMFSAGKPAAK